MGLTYAYGLENVSAYVLPVGIPDPATSFGYDPIAIEEPADPANWPSAVSTGSYYIDPDHGSATDTDNTYGYPDQPRSTIPTSMTVTGKCVIAKSATAYSGGTITITTSGGTSGSPIWITGRDSGASGPGVPTTNPQLDDRRLQITGSDYTICQYIDVIDYSTTGGCFTLNTSYSTCRHCDFAGNGLSVGFSRAVNDSADYQCFYRVDVHEFGDNTLAAAENDYHGFKPDQTSNKWFLETSGYQLGGDWIQIADAADDPANTRFIYIGGGSGYSNKENAIDVKSCSDVIISGVEAYDHSPTSHSAGEGIVVHDDNQRVWVINCIARNNAIGIISTGGEDFYAIGNLIYDNTNGTWTEDSGFGGQVGLHVRNHNGDVMLALNTFHNNGHNIQLTTDGGAGGVDNVDVTGNIFGERAQSLGHDIRIGNSAVGAATNVDDNVYDSKRVSLNGGTETGSEAGDPGFTNEAGDDFTLAAGSRAIDHVSATIAAFSIFNTLYGRSIATDIAGTARPQGSNNDAGAYERQ